MVPFVYLMRPNMPSKIRVLNEHTINQIAAGEVIENPASVVKELVENSIDAGATEICVEIKGGGRQLIRITDNGSGMNSDDALLCLERHATSKIKEAEDIHTIYTMGFRGEAIPSIASISKFSLLTRAEGDLQGTLVTVDGGRIMQCSPAACSQGTTIEVKSLFFNVPVRRKFQKSPQIDTNDILKMLSSLALGHEHIKFELISNQETILSTPIPKQDNQKERIKCVLGSDYFSSLVPIEGKRGEIELRGFIGLPAFTKQNRTGQYLFINQRNISNALISYAIREGYGTTLASNRHPIYVLHLSIPGHTVDINVHPQKREVRLRQEQDLKQLIIGLVESALQNAGFTYSNDFVVLPPVTFNEPPAFKSYISFEPLHEEAPRRPLAVKNPIEAPSLFPKEEKPIIPRVIATILNYIIIDSQTTSSKDSALCLIDQRAAHARIIFEKLLQKQNGCIQPLLIPYAFETTPIEASYITEQLSFLNEIGIHMHQSGPQSFIVDAILDLFAQVDLHALITSMVHEPVLTSDKEKSLAIAASRVTLSRNKKLTIDEAQSLVNRLLNCKTPYYCPQGKSTLLHMKTEEIEKFFKG